MREVEGSLFDAPERAIGHGVNMKGLMGAGIAAEFARRYPEMLPAYKLWYHDVDEAGHAMLYKAQDGKIIVNIGSQYSPGRDATYQDLIMGVSEAAFELVTKHGVHELAIPRIGCGIGGLDWEAVKVILIVYEVACEQANDPFEFIIYTPEAL